MENSKEGHNAEKDLESQEQPINANSPSSSEPKAEQEDLTEGKEKTAEVRKAQAQAEDFWKKIYNSMKNVESKEQAESLFKGLSSSKRVDTNTPAKVEAQSEWPNSSGEVRKASELRAREKALVADGFVDVVVDSASPEMFPYVAKKVDEESYAPEEKLKSRRRKRYLCCNTARFWCTLMLLIPILVVLLTMYFVVLTPKDPTTSVEGVSISEFKLVDDGVGGTSIETKMNFTVTLKNPNRFAEVVYERLNVLLAYRSTAVASVSVDVAGYKQQERNLTMIEVEMPKTSSPITSADDAQALTSEVSSGNVRMEFRGIAEGHFKIAGIKMGSFDAPVDCKLNIRPESSTQSAALISASCYTWPT